MMIQSDDYGIFLAKGIKKAFEENGGKVIAEKHFNLRDTDFYTQLTAIKNLNFDTLYIAGYSTPADFIFKQAKELGITATMGATIGASQDDTLKKVSCNDVEGTYDLATSTDALLQSGRAETLRVVEAYKKRYHKDMNGLAMYAHDGIKLLAAGIEKAGTIDNIPKIMEGLHQLKIKDIDHLMVFTRPPAPGTDGLVFDANGQAYVQTGLAKWENCRVKFIKWIK